jgi:hypothetical protein
MKRRNAAVALLLADLRDELLTPPSASQTAEHIAMMRFEEQVAPAPAPRPRASAVRSSPRPAPAILRGRVRSATSTRPRRFAALFAAICVLSGSVGLDAAAAVPAAVRRITEHITDTIVHTFGVPQAPAPSSAGAPARVDSASVIAGPGPERGPASSAAASSASAPSTSVSPATGAPHVSSQQAPTSGAPAVTPDDPSSSPAPPAEPPVDSQRPPKHNMGKDPNTPPGLPSDWSSRAVAAARTQLATCALATDLSPVGCPQVAAVAAGVTPRNVQWTLLNQPLAGASAFARANGVARQATISVFGLFQMEATYTVGTDALPQYAYSSGVAQATMTWDGSTLLAVTFTSGSVAGQLPDGVHVPAFERSPSATDAAVLAALQSGFAAWVTSAGGTLVGDPTQGAVVSFDPAHGNFTVTGSYTPASTDPGSAPMAQPYTAILVANGTIVQLLSIAGS